jgi:plastocyanin
MRSPLCAPSSVSFTVVQWKGFRIALCSLHVDGLRTQIVKPEALVAGGSGHIPTGGCSLKDGDVTFAEFGALLTSILSTAVVGHPAWRFQPSYVNDVEPSETVRVTNDGGRAHTFTEVTNFGGGFVPPLNIGLTFAPECAGATVLAPDDRVELRELSAGDHRFQCCIHPWMRALIKVEAD